MSGRPAEVADMKKELLKGSILFGPLPAVLVTTVNAEGVPNVFTVAWVGVACTHPPMLTISVRKERLSHENIQATGEFVVNLTTRKMVKMTDFCGCRSGRKLDKIKHLGLELDPGAEIAVPSLVMSPVALECKVKNVTELGSHDLFLAEVVANKVDKDLFNADGKIELGQANLLAYCHGEYHALTSHPVGSFGFSVASRATRRKKHQQRKNRSPSKGKS